MHALIEPLFVLVFVAFVFSVLSFIDALRAPSSIERRIGFTFATALTFTCLLSMILHF